MIFISQETVPLFDGFSLALPFGLTCHRDNGLEGSTIFITDYLRRFTVSFEQGTDFSTMVPLNDNGWITYHANGKTLHQRRIVPRPFRNTGNYTFFKIELRNDKGDPVTISGQLATSFAYSWSTDAEPVLRAILKNITYQKDNVPSLEQNESQKEETMERKELVRFTVRVLSAENATWQGEVESGGEVFAFESEMQLLKWLCKKHPQLMPDVDSKHSVS